VNVRFGDRVRTIELEPKSTVAKLKILIAEAFWLPAKSSRDMKVSIGENPLLNPRQQMKAAGITSGSNLRADVRGIGGAGPRKSINKVSKTDRGAISRLKATSSYREVRPFILEPSLTERANTRYMGLMDNINENYLQELMKNLTLEDLELTNTEIIEKEVRMQESTIPRLSAFLIPEHKAVVDILSKLTLASKALEDAFHVAFTLCFYNEDTYRYDYGEFTKYLADCLQEKRMERELLVRHGLLPIVPA
jgi:hypothetical protein